MYATKQNGLTLVEMSVALFIFSLITISIIGVMSLSLNNEEIIARRAAILSDIEISRSLLKMDLIQTVARPVRDEDGFVRHPPFAGGDVFDRLGVLEDGQILLAMVVSGHSEHIFFENRSRLQYVEYIYREKKIVRRSRHFLDAIKATKYRERILFNNVDEVDIMFFNGTVWLDSFSSSPEERSPIAISLEFIHPVYGEMRQLFYGGVV